jgi:hypothetical protein
VGLLTLKEIEYLDQPQTGTLHERLQKMIDELLRPLEEEWFGGTQTGGVVPRVRNLRVKMLPDMVAGRITPDERAHRWRQLARIYLAQQLSCYPPDYLRAPTVDRVLETLERFEEDLSDEARVNGPLHVILEVGEAIEVSPERDRKAAVDPLMAEIQHALETMINRLAKLSPPISEGDEQHGAGAIAAA